MMFCRWTILDSVIICIPSIQMGLKYRTVSQQSASYLNFNNKIGNGGKMKIKLYDSDDFTFPIISFSIISRNIPAYGVYIS